MRESFAIIIKLNKQNKNTMMRNSGQMLKEKLWLASRELENQQKKGEILSSEDEESKFKTEYGV